MRNIIVLLTCVVLLSCAKEPVFPEQHAQGEVKTYTLTVTAGKGESPDTRALVFEGEKLKARWTAGEQVTVYKEDVSIGTLTARYDGQSTKLDGQVTGELKTSDVLTLKFLSPDYESQDGTIDYIAAHCDYAVANVAVTDVTGATATTTPASFVNQQAIAAITLKYGEEGITSGITALTITAGTETYRITRSAGPGPIYVAMKPVESETTLAFAATDGTLYYVKTFSGKTLSQGNYYALTLGMSLDTDLISYVRRSWDEASKSVVSETVVEKANDLHSISEYENLTGTWYVSGTLDIKGTASNPKGITVCENGNLNLVLCDGAQLETDYIWIGKTSTLRIFGQKDGTGTLLAKRRASGPAIGLYPEVGNGGTMEFHGGVITAKGYNDYPAIGAGDYYWDRLAIYGGRIDATGGERGSGIGRGYNPEQHGGVIDIYGGNITACGGRRETEGHAGGSGIGDGGGSDYNDNDDYIGGTVKAVNIYGGTINATGTNRRPGIGAGLSGTGAVNIYGGKVIATGGDRKSGLYATKEINISGGEVLAYAGRDAAAIGSGKELDNPAVIHISGGSVQARGDNEDYNSYGAGIGAGQNGNGGTILISGGTVYAYGGMDAAGIGCGEKSSWFSSKNSGNITITGGWVYAKGKGYGAGIGAGEDAYCNAVNIFTTAGPLRVEAIAGEQCENAGSIGAYDYDDIKWTLNIGPLVRVDIYNGSTWDHLVRTDDRADRVHHSTRALLYTCDHGGGPIEDCNFCDH